MKKLRLFFGSSLIIAVVFSQMSFAIAQTLPADDTTAPTADSAPSAEMMPDAEMPVGPSVSSVSVTDITDTSARIDVNSDEMVQGYVEYGTTEQYGHSTPLTSEFTTNPEFLLENLTSETLYHYRVIVMDSSANAAITSDETFTTLATPEPEPTPPTDTSTATTTGSMATSTPSSPVLAVSNTETASISTSTARITWQTNLSADSQVQYGTTNSYGSLSALNAFSTSHAVSLAGLTPDTKYYYRAFSKTSSGETAYGSPQQFTTLAMQAPPSPPLISKVSTAVSTSSVTITWTTSKPATSDIQYGTTTSYGFTVGKDAALKTSHSRTINNLSSSFLYHFRLVVADERGNTGLGKDRTFTTSATSATTSAPSAPAASTTPVPGSGEILSNVAEKASQAIASTPRGGGGIPVAPTRPMLLKVTPLDGQVSFDWRKDQGGHNGDIHTLIVKKRGTSYVQSRIDGKIIYDGPSTTFTDTNVENGTEYHYALYSYGAFGRFTPAAHFKVVPQADREQIDLIAPETVEITPPSFSRDLFQGKQGDDVSNLQRYLTRNGYYPEGLVTGYFGPLTRVAVIRYQKLNDITPAAGYVGQITRAFLSQ